MVTWDIAFSIRQSRGQQDRGTPDMRCSIAMRYEQNQEMGMSENRLSRETSPYLLQHQDNPVHWWAWGPEALAEAKATGKPILLSVGYAACHWCHVMAHESFEDQATADVMNALFVNIKVDREERPRYRCDLHGRFASIG